MKRQSTDEAGTIQPGRMIARLTRAALCAALLFSPGCGQKLDRPNFLLITIDTLRAGHLACYGYFRETAPTIDKLAAESIFFERCYVPMATTLPSHTSLLTGTYPIEHGVLANVRRGGFRFEPSPELRSYAEIAQAAGYTTAAFVSATPLKKATGIDAGFDYFDQPENEERRATKTNEALFSWLDLQEDGPWFLWVHYYDPHFPYQPEYPYSSLFSDSDGIDEYMTERRFAKKIQLPNGGFLPIQEMVNNYDGEIRAVDDRIAELIKKLKSRGEWENTLLVLTSDHGEGLGQHGRTGHSFTWEEQLHVPAIIRIPGVPPRRVPQVISQVDLLPTFLQLARDLLPTDGFFKQATGRFVLHDDFLATPVLGQDCEIQRHDPELSNYVLTTARWKFVHEPEGGDRLYDLHDDPHELNDVSADHPDTTAYYSDQLFEMLATQQVTGAKLAAGKGDSTYQFDPELRKELEALGYTN